MSLRILIICLGFVLTYATVYFADGLHVMAVTDYASNPENAGESGMFLGTAFAAIISFVVAAMMWLNVIKEVIAQEFTKDIETTVVSTTILILACFSFGVIVGPFANYGPYPWQWVSRFDLLPLFALVPTIFVIYGIVEDAIQAKRTRNSRNNVTPIRKEVA